MAKGKPTASNIRQGQTIYEVRLDWNVRDYVVEPMFLHSQKTPLPPDGCIVEKMPVDTARMILRMYGNKEFFATRNRAQRHADMLKRQPYKPLYRTGA